MNPSRAGSFGKAAAKLNSARAESPQIEVKEPQLVQAHSVYGGTAYGPNQRILVEGACSRLMFVPGHTSYVSRSSGSKYSSASLYLVRDDMAFSRRIILRKEGVRLSRSLLALPDVQAAITGEWGPEVAAAVDPARTIVLRAATGARASVYFTEPKPMTNAQAARKGLLRMNPKGAVQLAAEAETAGRLRRYAALTK